MLKMCGNLCLQHKVNEYLDGYKKGLTDLNKPASHVKKTSTSKFYLNLILNFTFIKYDNFRSTLRLYSI